MTRQLDMFAKPAPPPPAQQPAQAWRIVLFGGELNGKRWRGFWPLWLQRRRLPRDYFRQEAKTK